VFDTNRAWCSKLPTPVKLFPHAISRIAFGDPASSHFAPLSAPKLCGKLRKLMKCNSIGPRNTEQDNNTGRPRPRCSYTEESRDQTGRYNGLLCPRNRAWPSQQPPVSLANSSRSEVVSGPRSRANFRTRRGRSTFRGYQFSNNDPLISPDFPSLRAYSNTVASAACNGHRQWRGTGCGAASA
jgi:hypothetical protein